MTRARQGAAPGVAGRGDAVTAPDLAGRGDAANVRLAGRARGVGAR